MTVNRLLTKWVSNKTERIIIHTKFLIKLYWYQLISAYNILTLGNKPLSPNTFKNVFYFYVTSSYIV